MNAVNSQSFRNIVYNPQDGTITLYTKNTGYQMKIDKYGSLLHTWYLSLIHISERTRRPG